MMADHTAFPRGVERVADFHSFLPFDDEGQDAGILGLP
jgi:hypothetical protein